MPKLVIMDQGGDMTKTWDEETQSQTEEILTISFGTKAIGPSFPIDLAMAENT